MHKFNHHIELCSKIIVLCLLNIVLTTGIILSSNITSAESSSANAAVTVPEACTMTSTNNTPHTATLSPNTYSGASGSDYENGIGKTTLSVVCNDYNGFSIYAIGFTGNSYDSANHTKLVGSNTGNTISTAVYTNNTTPSNWSMKVTKVTDSSVSYNPTNMSIQNSFDSWHIIPDTYTKVAQYKASTGSSTTDTTLGAKVETTYAAFIAENQSADTYIGQVKYTMVHPYDNTAKDGPITNCPANKICYSPNANDIEGTMGQQSIYSSTTSATLLASNFSRTGYGFAGWSDRHDYTNDNGAHFYGPQETITFTAGQYNTTNGGLRLYAIWIPSAGSLQDSTKIATLCGTGAGSLTQAPTDGTANLSSVSALTDQRDNETYAIAKLADGNCWMIENLRLENTAEHNSDGSLAQGYNASFAGLADPEAPWANHSIIANTIYSIDGSTDKTISGNYQGYRFPRYNNINTPTTVTDRPNNPTSNADTNSASNAGMYSYGNYYTWTAAIADTTDYYVNNQSIIGTSICPYGWQLPRGGDKIRIESNDDNDFWNLIVDGLNGGTSPANYDSSTRPYYTGTPEGSNVSNALRAYPNNFIYSGIIVDGSLGIRGSFGYYFSSTVNSNYYAYILYLYSSDVYPGTFNNSNKSYGASIRCLASGA